MSGTPTTTGADTAAPDLKLSPQSSEKDDDKHEPQTQVFDISERHNSGTAEDEPVTGRLELWSWYGYYFGNNSAGTLSYAPLSTQHWCSILWLGGLLILSPSLPVTSQPSWIQWERCHPRLQRLQCPLLGRIRHRNSEYQFRGADLQWNRLCHPGSLPAWIWSHV